MKNEQVSTPVEPLGRAFASTRAVLVQAQAGEPACLLVDARALMTGNRRRVH
jgi:FixJ family two-component response regulator